MVERWFRASSEASSTNRSTPPKTLVRAGGRVLNLRGQGTIHPDSASPAASLARRSCARARSGRTPSSARSLTSTRSARPCTTAPSCSACYEGRTAKDAVSGGSDLDELRHATAPRRSYGAANMPPTSINPAASPAVNRGTPPIRPARLRRR